MDGPPFISELKLFGANYDANRLHILHIINGRDCGLPLIPSVFTSKEAVYILLADSHSLQLFLLIQANQANAPATDDSPTASIDAADRLEILSNSFQYHTNDSIDVIQGCVSTTNSLLRP